MIYKPKTVYTERELIEADILDLETDYRCAIQDSLSDYADKVLAQLKRAQQKLKELG